MKPLVFVGNALNELRAFPDEARRAVGFQLRKLQSGEVPNDFKPMPTVGAGVLEIRIRAAGAWRVFYVTKFNETVYVLHAFQKQTQQTAARDLEIGRQRYKEVQA